MGRPPTCHCHCVPCPDYTVHAPTENDPAEPHDARTVGVINELAGEGSPTIETVTTGIAATVTVTPDGRSATGSSSPGCRRLQISAASSGGAWTAGVIFWDDAGFSYDPSLRGSIARLRTLASVRLAKNSTPYDDAGPAINFGPVIEQGGNRYYAADSFVTAPADTCWTGWQGRAADSDAPHQAARPPKLSEGRHWTDMPDKLGRCDGWLFEADGAGSFLVDNTPDVSFDRVSRPVTRFGLWIALTSDYFDDSPYGTPTSTPPGNYLLDVLIDNLYLELETWGVYRLDGAVSGTPFPFGSTLIDDPLTSIPAWTQTGLSIVDSAGDSEQCWNMANATLVGGYLGQDGFSGGDEYDAFRLGTTIPMPPSNEDFQLTIDFTWHSIRDRDHVNTTGILDASESRKVQAGFWLDKLLRFTVWREGSDHQHDCGLLGYTMSIPTMADGGSDLGQTISATPATGTCDYANGNGQLTGWNPGCGPGLASGFSRPLEGDRFTVIVRKFYTDAEVTARNLQNAAILAGGAECLAFSRIYPEARYIAYVYVNGRLAFSNFAGGQALGWSNNAFGMLWFPDANINIGLLGLCGGRVSDFRVRSRT